MFTAIPFGPHELFDLVNDPDERENLIDLMEHRAVKEALQADLEAWFVWYADPTRDGSREAVMGRGQLDIVGPAAKGRKRFGDDVVYYADQLDSK